MKFLTLDLRAVGPFTDRTIEFPSRREGFHVLYGPNEAGKSSALRAIEYLLFGFPQSTPDAFLHSYPKLRVGARIEHSDGTILDVVRRKGKQNSLLKAGDETETVPEAELQRCLGGLNQDSFLSMFGINHARLLDGGREIAEGNGELGQALFNAGAGIANLSKVQKTLESEQAALFAPRAQNPRINSLLREYDSLKKTLRDQMVSIDAWMEHRRKLESTKEQLATLEGEIRDLVRSSTRLQRLQRAHVKIAKRNDTLSKLEPLATTPLLRDGFGAEASAADQQRRTAEVAIQRTSAAIEELDSKLARNRLPETLLKYSEAIEQLQQPLGQHLKAKTDATRLEAEAQVAEQEARQLLKGLTQSDDLSSADKLRLPATESAVIQSLAESRERIVTKLDAATANAREHAATIAEAEQSLTKLPSVADPSALRQFLDKVAADANLDDQIAEIEQSLNDGRRKIEIENGKLAGWKGSWSQVETAAFPDAEAIDHFQNLLDAAEKAARDIQERIDAETADIRETQKQCDLQQREHDVPLEEDLIRSRAIRDAGWQCIRHRLTGKTAPDEAAFLEAMKPQTDAVAAFERSVEQVDAIADRLRREAKQVEQRARLLATLNDQQATLEQLRQKRSTLQTALQEARDQWQAPWKAAGVEPLSPREMRGWRRRCDGLLEAIRSLQTDEHALAALKKRHEKLHCELVAMLSEGADRQLTLAGLIDRGRAVCAQFESNQRQRERWQDSIAAGKKALLKEEKVREEMRSAFERWQSDWASAMNRLGLPPDAETARAGAHLSALADLNRYLNKANSDRQRIAGIERDAAGFTDRVKKVAENVAPELVDWDAAQAVDEMTARLKAARQAEAKHQKLLTERTAHEQQRQAAETALSEATVKLDACCRDAGCTTPADLANAERRSNDRRRLEQQLTLLEEQLLEDSGGQPLDEILKEAAGVDADSVPGMLADIAQQIERKNAEASELNQAYGGEKAELARMDGSDVAAQTRAEMEENLARLANDSRQYVLTRLASAVLTTAIDRYQKKNQGPVLERTKALFAQMTVHSFERIQIEPGDSGPRLVGVRPDGSSVDVDGMSDGSRDQLYLALRLASIEAQIDKREPLPFIVDDILLNFDDARAAAALQAIADLARKTQVLFFTHHRHLVDLARASVPSDLLFVHDL